MEDDLNFCKMDDNLKKIMQPKTMKSKNNDCGTALGNQVLDFIIGYLAYVVQFNGLCTTYLLKTGKI